jgi:hypothetical protein
MNVAANGIKRGDVPNAMDTNPAPFGARPTLLPIAYINRIEARANGIIETAST